MFALTRAESRARAVAPLRQAARPQRIAGDGIRSRGGSAHPAGQRCACGGGCPRCQAEPLKLQAAAPAERATDGWHPQEQGTGVGDSAPQGGTSRKDLFCHKCQAPKSLKVSVYSQWSSDFRESNILFAKIFMLNHNVALDIQQAGVIPSLYDEEAQKFGKVETIADLCDIVRDLEVQGSLPASGIPALFLPFGQQLRGDAADTIGWHIPDINVNCEPHVGKLKTTKVLLIDSSPDVKSCSKVLLHEIGHAVGNGDVKESTAIMGPCDPGSPQKPPIGCDPDATHNLMTAREVKKFCAA